MLYDIVGLSVLFFLFGWGIYGLYLLIRQRRPFIGILVGMVAFFFTLGFLYLTASNLERRAYINLDMRQLATNVALIGLSALVAALLFALIWKAARWEKRETWARSLLISAVGMGLVTVVFSLWLYRMTFEPDLDEVFVAAASATASAWQVKVPITIYDDSHVAAPTALALDPQNHLYVASNEGTIWLFVDDDLDGVPERTLPFATGLAKPQGLAWHESGLYVNEEGKLTRWTDTDGDLVADESTLILDDLGRESYAFHRNHGLVFGNDGRLYIGIGSSTDGDPEPDPMRARVISILPDGSDLQHFATGLRNPYGIVPEPGGDGFFAVENGPSVCVEEKCVIRRGDVPEEINYLRAGNDYGFPWYIGVPPQDSGTMPPVMSLPEHSAPTGIVIYEGEAFPPEVRGQLFFSLWARGEIWRTALFKIDENHYTASPTLFASGIPGPSALLNSPYGGLFVTAYSANAIYHIGKVPGQ